jgi:hypothetical protein
MVAGLQSVASAFWVMVIGVKGQGMMAPGGFTNGSGNLGVDVETKSFPWLASLKRFGLMEVAAVMVGRTPRCTWPSGACAPWGREGLGRQSRESLRAGRHRSSPQ